MFKKARRTTAVFLGLAMASGMLFQCVSSDQEIPVARASTGNIVISGASSNNSNGWTNPANAYGTTDNNTYATATPGLAQTITGDWAGYGFDSLIPTDAEITKVEIITQYSANGILPLGSGLDVSAVVSNTVCGTTTDTSFPASDTDFTIDVTACRAWTRANLLDANFEVRLAARRSLLGLLIATFSVDHISVRITYDRPALTQAAYRIFANNNSTDVGAALAAQDAPYTLSGYGQAFRIRMLLHNADAPLPVAANAYKLQYVDRGSGSCDAPSGGTPAAYTDVTASTAIAFNDNASPSDGASLTANASDPTHSGHTIRNQTYEELNNFTSTVLVADGEDGKWDFSLIDNNSSARTYCFRVVHADGSAIQAYAVYPQITTLGTLTIDIVDSGGSSVASPSVPFSAHTVSFDCDNSTGTLGISAQRIRVTNTTANPQWSVSLAATGGAAAVWTTGSVAFDYNDPSGTPAGCGDGGDADSVAGRLLLNPSVMTISPQSGCTDTNLSKGSQSSYSQGVTDSITLLTAGASTQTNCYWDLTDISTSQSIPGDQAMGNYTISFTITLISI